MYRRTQTGSVFIVILLGVLSVVLVVGVSTGGHPILLLVGAILLCVLVLFRSLTIDIDGSQLRCYFGGGLIGRRFPLSSIQSATAVRNKWYYGLGIRLVPSGWMFAVSGLDAVELELDSGKRFRIGTDRPDEVVEALDRLRA